ncbi:transmembrane protein [Mycolicibacterium aurum]|uniref:Transmembrane protein n=1 Tax=Mycolicibacterium aurum TaxID=1791 RepID=A0A3S4TER9_MYCAU|nr:DUF5336 domain-containing protein [Mycolicibacterium aurum]VEG57563.1 transmembrane protein [Mycolicibacterium aurum]
MSYPQGAPGGSGYPPAQQPTPQFGTPTQQFNTAPEAGPAAEGPSKLPVFLNAATAVLGLLVYLSSFGPQFSVDASDFPGVAELSGSSFGVLFAVIAAVVAGLLAAVGLLRKQPNFTAVVAVAAVLGFLLVLGDSVNSPAGTSIDWGLYLVIAFTLLQAAVAVVVLLFDSGVITPPVPRPKYEQPQQQYGQYPGQYYGQPHGGQQHQGPQQQRPGYPTPYGGSTGGYPGSGQNTGGFPASPQSGPPTPPTGFPTYGQPPASNAPTTQVPTQHQSPSSSQPDQSS